MPGSSTQSGWPLAVWVRCLKTAVRGGQPQFSTTRCARAAGNDSTTWSRSSASSGLSTSVLIVKTNGWSSTLRIVGRRSRDRRADLEAMTRVRLPGDLQERFVEAERSCRLPPCR